MVEIAISVGVIGFALVAIIGILPRGMGVQKENREDTIISQDAPYFLNAIRNGEQRTNNNILANYVESITVTNIVNSNSVTYSNLYYDMNIIGLLSTPEYDPRLALNQNCQTIAIVRAMTGSAVQQNGANSATAFRYQLTVENTPWVSTASDLSIYVPGSFGWLIQSNRNNELQYLTNSLHDLRLKFAWPVLPNGNIGPFRQTYRTLVSSHLLGLSNGYNPTLWFFQPQTYTTSP
jgi:hypothetical protein